MPIPEEKFTSSVGEIIAARAETIGSPHARQSMQDRSEIKVIKTNGGLELLVGVIADGMGGGEDGEIAAEITKEEILASILASTVKDVAQILSDAILAAHQKVTGDGSLRNAGSTATVAAVSNDRLYVANVGDSRAYLVRDGKLYQLTEDQTWGNEQVKAGRATVEEVKRLSKRGELAQYVGYMRPIRVDCLARFPENQESSFVELKPGDGILLCSDGLIKNRPDSESPFVYDHEITNTFAAEPPLSTANMLVAFAKGRRVDDNVSAIVMQVSGKKLPAVVLSRVAMNGKKYVMPAVIGILVLVVVFFLATLLPGIIGSQPETTHAVGLPTEKVVVAEGTARVIEASLAQFSMPGKNAEYVKAGDTIEGGQGTRLWTPTGGRVVLELMGGQRIYIDQSTQIYLLQLADAGKGITTTLIRMERGNIYVSGDNAEFRVESAKKEGWFAQVKGSKMGVSFDGQNNFDAECFSGSCSVGMPEKEIVLQAGQGGGFEEAALTEARNGVYDPWIKIAGEDVPRPTATATMTPTMTPTATLTPTITPTHIYIPPTPKPADKKDDPNKKKDPPPGSEG